MHPGAPSSVLSLGACLLLMGGALAADDKATTWTTYRGNPQRTGNTDGVALPAMPKVLWVHRSQEHFIASPVPDGERVFISGLGAFNVSSFYCLATDPKAAQRVAWSKSTPFLKLPTVSSPAIIDGKIIFGDGMHQTDGALLHCLRVEKGLPLWQMRTPPPDHLVHLEGSPTIADRKAYLGGGSLGVICVDIDKVTLDGKEMDTQEIQKILDKKWQELLAKYAEEKKKDPDFAVPPNEDQLPKPTPRQLWQQGKVKWHVDAPVAVIGDRVLVASAFLDKEKEGDRALFCLNAKNGEIVWRSALTVNPWGGPSVSDNLVVVSGSSIGFDPKSLKGAKGELVAFNLADGKEVWRKELKGGVVSCVAISGGSAICTATDGKVRSYDVKTGDLKWFYDARAPLFACPAVVGGVVYAGDLAGVLHAIALDSGAEKWKIDVGADPAVKAPGMIYGGPVVHGGRLFVATCNIEGPNVNKPTAFVCIGEK